MFFHQRPEAVGAWVIVGAVVHEKRSAQQQGAEYQPGAHHPAHIGHPIDDVARPHIGAEGHVLRGLDRETTMGVYRSLGPACRARRVDDHQRVLGSGTLGLGLRGLLLDELVPPMIAAMYERHVDIRMFEHDQVL